MTVHDPRVDEQHAGNALGERRYRDQRGKIDHAALAVLRIRAKTSASGLIFAAMRWRNSGKIKFNKVAARDGRMKSSRYCGRSLLRAGVNAQHRASRGSQGSRCSAAVNG